MAQPNLTAVQQQIQSNPGIQAALQAYADRVKSRGGAGQPLDLKQYEIRVQQALRQAGIVMPHDYFLRADTGQIVHRNFVDRNPWLMPLMVAGVGVGAALAAAPAAAGGGGGAAAGGSGTAAAAGQGLGMQGLAPAATAGGGISGGAGATTLGTTAASSPHWWQRGAQNVAGQSPSLAQSLIGAGASAGLGALAGQTGQTEPALTPEQQAMMTQLLQMSVDRQNRITPIHEAAMRLAGQLAPTGGNSPRMNSAIQSSLSPRPTQQTSPQMLEAIQRLMGGGR
jgi:hypothetical protein